MDKMVWPLQKKKKKNCRKIESFFDVIGIFGSGEPYSESAFPFQYIIIFQTYQYLEPPSSTPVGDRHMRPLTLVQEI